jgi:hypothetical protein
LWKDVEIDSCIADLVEALQTFGIDMRGSCCGHLKRIGHISLQDGRELLILNKETNERFQYNRSKFFFLEFLKAVWWAVFWRVRYLIQFIKGSGSINLSED